MIKNNDNLTNAFIAFQKVFQAENDTPQADKQDVLFALIEQYKRQYTLFEVPYLFAEIGNNVGEIKRSEFDDVKRNWE